MKTIAVDISNVQHIKRLRFELDVSRQRILCVTGRNGSGKTTLVRAFRNLTHADTFLKTAPPRIFNAESRIIYEIDDARVDFTFDSAIQTINCRQAVPVNVRNSIVAELPMPYGTRFNYARSASDADDEIRKCIAVSEFQRPAELVEFLKEVYEGSVEYDQLFQVSAKGKDYFALLRQDSTYIREDFLSSGEFFLISLYRTIKARAKLIVVDEIELSLDAAAQVKLAAWLRRFCKDYECTVLFTTHSLALIDTLESDEIAFLESQRDGAAVAKVSHSFVRARLFGFRGWDRYILTEDEVSTRFISYLLERWCGPRFLTCKVIHIGGASQVVSILERNRTDSFLADKSHVIAVLDGDQAGKGALRRSGVFFLPIPDVEKALFIIWKESADFIFSPRRSSFSSEKDFFNHLQQTQIASAEQLFDVVYTHHKSSFDGLVKSLTDFLAPPSLTVVPVNSCLSDNSL